MLRSTSVLLLLFVCARPTEAQQGPEASPTLTLEQIMAHPDWIGREPEGVYWADDGRSLYYRQKREGEDGFDLFQVDVESGRRLYIFDGDRGSVDVAGGSYDRQLRRKAFVRSGDVFVKDLQSGHVDQLTRTPEPESAPLFLLDTTRVAFTRDGAILVRDLTTGLEEQPADVRFEVDPDEKELEEDEERDYLALQQERLIETPRARVRKRRARRELERTRQAADPTRAPMPWYLGDEKQQTEAHLSPDGRWLMLEVSDADEESGKRDALPEYVTESSWVETRDVRAHVGFSGLDGESLILLDLVTRQRHDLDLAALPEIATDRLGWLEEQARERELAEPVEFGHEGDQGFPEDDDEDEPAEEAETEPGPRGVSLWNVQWAPDGSTLAFMARSLDNKDRWIARVDLSNQPEIVPVHHLVDEAWVGLSFNEMGWLPDSSGLWFTSEETGWAQLYLLSFRDDAVRPLTEGEFEIHRVVTALDGSALYFRANLEHPGAHEICRYVLPDGPFERLTELGGKTYGVLSPDGTKLALTHSKPLQPPEIYWQEARAGAPVTKLTETVSAEFRALPWVAPEVVEIPSRAGGTIHARLYRPVDAGPGPYPAVAFVHGAGYLQNAHLGWSGYFREFMFHSLLAHEGYVVIDVDYRASAGYGRDWRTAIYRRMGTPELEDYEDAVQWLAQNESVDPARVGVYGGSYGGFLTLMALFTRPELFACGAALRPVTDWAHYNHSYTSNILNTPAIDHEAFEASSPIEFAEGLEKPLLICHGMLDDNVLVKDSIRLAQRLIELEKEDWELALYPVEGHAFEEPASWLDEYRRIHALFEEHLK